MQPLSQPNSSLKIDGTSGSNIAFSKLGMINVSFGNVVRTSIPGDRRGLPPSGGDGLRVDPHLDEFVGLPQQLGGQHGDGSGAVSYFVVLHWA